MRLLIFCPQFAPVIGGAERQAQRQAAELCRRGVEVEVWTPRLDPTSPAYEVVDGVPVTRFPLWQWPRHHWLLGHLAVLNGPSLMLQIACRLGRAVGHADLVHCHLYGLLTLAVGLTARARLRPVVCKAAIAGRGSDIGEMKRTSFFNRRVAGWGRWCFTRWIATTDAVADQLRSAGVETARIVKIPNGIALRPGPKIVSRVRRFLYVGRLSSNINRDTDGLLSAFDRVADKHADVHLALVGGGDLLDHTRLLAASARHADRIQVVGFADPTPWLQWADCFVLPSRNEGLSNALLEAMERGLVCVANDIGPNREALADGRAGILVPVEDRVCLAETLQSLIADDAVASDFSRAARGRAESAYGMEAVVSLVQHAYSKLHAWSS